MNDRTLGRTGFRISAVAYGLWGMSGWSDSDDKESLQSLQLSADLGCNFYDSAWAYGQGKSDRFLGQILHTNPGKRLFAASKIPPKNETWPALPQTRYEEAFPAEHVFNYADKIRKALGVDTIDLLQFHVWNDDWAALKEFRATIEKLKRDKIAAAFGISLNRWEPANGIRAIQTGLVDSVQVIYNVFDQNPEDELFPACREHRIGVIARVPLDEGSLGGKMTCDTRFPAEDWRAKYFNEKNLKETMDRVDALRKDLPEGMSLPELSIRFILSEPAVSTVIVGMRKLEHVRLNLEFSEKGPLSQALVSKLRKHRWVRRPAHWSA